MPRSYNPRMNSALRPDVCIRGAGIVGQVLALLLARERLRVALVQAVGAPAAVSPTGHGDVRAYALNRASRQLLEGLRVWPALSEATPLAAMDVHGDAEGAAQGALHFSAAELGTDALAWIVDVPALERLLADAVRYQPLIERVESPVPAPLTVVCEGRDSRTRAEFGVAYDTFPYGQHAIATRMGCERAHDGIARQWFLSDDDHGDGQGDILALLPLEGPLGRSVAVVWSTSPERAQALAALDEPGFAHALQAVCDNALGDMQCIAPRAVWPLQLSRAHHWVGTDRAGNAWVLAGDAAHAVHPLAGQGLSLGLADAECLARTLHQREYFRGIGERRLLRRYERERQLDVKAMALVTDGLQRLFTAPGSWVQSLRNQGLSAFDHSGPIKQWFGRQAMGSR